MKKRSIMRGTKKKNKKNKELEPLNFLEINERVKSFAEHIESCFDELANILLEYESYEVIEDETARTLDLLKNLHENKKYFVLRIGSITSFLPKNQPLYSLACFVLAPSLMASDVHFRMPYCMRHFYDRFFKILEIHKFFPNVFASKRERLDFLRERSAVRINASTEETIPVTDAVIFTGTSHHAERLRLVFDHRTLVILNGAGHNPIVVGDDADVTKAVEAILKLQLYNQGQDCAAPNAILVHGKVFHSLLFLLREELRKIKVGHYRDRSCRVGPISEPDDLKRIQQILVDNLHWLDPSTPGLIRSADSIVEPTIICKPLKTGGNFTEVFAPIFFVQQYKKDDELASYFEHPHYSRNAMYVTLFGTSKYIEKIIGKEIEGKILHDRNSFIHNTHLHAEGVERGTQPYGGHGYAASSLSIHGKIISKATLPQRDIFEFVIKPLLRPGKIEERRKLVKAAKKVQMKELRKLLGLKNIEGQEHKESSTSLFIDVHDLRQKGKRYISIPFERTFFLLDKPNVEYIASMEPKHLHQIRLLKNFLKKHRKIKMDQLTQELYSIPKNKKLTDHQNRLNQLEFFRNIYQLLLGKDYGPRLAQFLIDANRTHILLLLNV